MGAKIFSNQEIMGDIAALSQRMLDMKEIMFKHIVMKNESFNSSYILRGLRSDINDYLSEKESLICDLKSSNVDISPNAYGKVVIYRADYIQGIVYANFDYSSMLPFIAGVMDGIHEKAFASNDDILRFVESFRDHTANMAFPNQPVDVAGLVDSVTDPQVAVFRKPLDDYDAKMMQSIAASPALYAPKHRIELYRALDKAFDYLDGLRVTDFEGEFLTPPAVIAIIGELVEYLTYSVASYAIRSMLISNYFGVIAQAQSIAESTYKEHTDFRELSDIGEPYLQQIDDLLIKDPKRVEELNRQIQIALDRHSMGYRCVLDTADPNVSSNSSEKEISYDYIIKSSFKHTKLYEAMKKFDLFDFLMDVHHIIRPEVNPRSQGSAASFRQLVELILTNRDGMNPDNIKPVLLAIRDFSYEDTLDGWKRLFKDMSMLTFIVANRLANMIDFANRNSSGILSGPSTFDLLEGQPIMSYGMEHNLEFQKTILALTQLYEEIVFTCVSKMKYLEMKMVSLHRNLTKDDPVIGHIADPTEIKSNHVMAMAVPQAEDEFENNRIIQRLHESPIFDRYTMMDRYLATLPEFCEDAYYKELTEDAPDKDEKNPVKQGANKVVDTVSNIISRLKAMMQALWQRIVNFWNGKSFAMSKKWVIENEKILLGMNFAENAQMDVFPYKEDISLPNGFHRLIGGLKAFNDSAARDKASVEKFLATLYPSDQIAQWYISDEKTAEKKYMNLILFDNPSEQDVPAVTIKGDQIKKNVAIWVESIKESDKTQESFKRINDEINTTIGSVNTKIASIMNARKGEPQGEIDIQLAHLADRISAAVNRLWAPISPMIIKAMITQYNYLKSAYSIQTQQELPNKLPSGAAEGGL